MRWEVAGLKAANEELQRQLAESQRGGKRQAAPFSKGRRSGKPRRPGRKPGTGLFSYRKPPSPDEVTEPVVEVAVSVEVCPGCGGRLEDEGMGVAYVTDIPPIRRPQVTAYPEQRLYIVPRHGHVCSNSACADFLRENQGCDFGKLCRVDRPGEEHR